MPRRPISIPKNDLNTSLGHCRQSTLIKYFRPPGRPAPGPPGSPRANSLPVSAGTTSTFSPVPAPGSSIRRPGRWRRVRCQLTPRCILRKQAVHRARRPRFAGVPRPLRNLSGRGSRLPLRGARGRLKHEHVTTGAGHWRLMRTPIRPTFEWSPSATLRPVTRTRAKAPASSPAKRPVLNPRSRRCGAGGCHPPGRNEE